MVIVFFFDYIPLPYFCVCCLVVWSFFVRLLINLATEKRKSTKMSASNFDEDQKYTPVSISATLWSKILLQESSVALIKR